MRRYWKSVFVLWSVVVIAASSCKHEPWEPEGGLPPSPDDTVTVDNPCDPNAVYFENDVLPIFQSSCAYAGCHDANTAQDGVILDSYQNVMSTGDIEPGNPEDSEVYENITENDPDKIMPPPPNSPLTAEQIQTIGAWISQGAQNNSCEQTDCDSTNVSYATDVTNVLQTHCSGCHGGSASSGAGIQMNTYSEVAALADNGRLLGAIQHDPGFTPMPLGQQPIDDCKIAIIRNWINEGTQDN